MPSSVLEIIEVKENKISKIPTTTLTNRNKIIPICNTRKCHVDVTQGSGEIKITVVDLGKQLQREASELEIKEGE